MSRAIVATILVLLAACGHLTSQDRAEVGEYGAQGAACIAANPGNKPAQDVCIAAERADWCAKWKARFDAGVCQ